MKSPKGKKKEKVVSIYCDRRDKRQVENGSLMIKNQTKNWSLILRSNKAAGGNIAALIKTRADCLIF